MIEQLAEGKLLLDRPAPAILRLTISNPQKRNALNREILDGIAEVVRGLTARRAGDPLHETRCIVVTGAHQMFSAGYEIGEIGDAQAQQEAESLVAHPFAEAIEALESFPYPTLAALPGHTIGGGLELAVACDLRVASSNIKLGMPPAKLGLVYPHTGIRRFIDAIGAARTRELFLLGEHIDADTALAWGLLTRVAAPERLERVALEMASTLAGNAPLSQTGNKRVIAAVLQARGALAEDVERELIELRAASFASDDMREGMSAFAEKRPPRWRGE